MFAWLAAAVAGVEAMLVLGVVGAALLALI
jgi:hypothetical protein